MVCVFFPMVYELYHCRGPNPGVRFLGEVESSCEKCTEYSVEQVCITHKVCMCVRSIYSVRYSVYQRIIFRSVLQQDIVACALDMYICL